MQVRQIQQHVSLFGRYASALYNEAKETNQIEEITKNVIEFKNLLSGHQELSKTIKLLHAKTTINIFTDIAKALNFSEIFLKFLEVIAKNKRINFLHQILNTFMDFIDRESNTTLVKIEVVKINSKHQEAIESLLQVKYPSQNLKYHYFAVPELMAGFRVFINEQCLDYSLRSRLNRLRYQLKGA